MFWGTRPKHAQEPPAPDDRSSITQTNRGSFTPSTRYNSDLSYLILFGPMYTNALFFTKPKDKALVTPKKPLMFPAAAGAVLSPGLSAGWGSGGRLLVLWTRWMSRTHQLLGHGSSFPPCYFVLAGSHILASCSSAHSQG